MKDGVNATPLPTVNTTGYIDHAAFLGTINPDTNKIPKHLFQGYLNIYNNYFKAPWMPDRTEANPNELNQDDARYGFRSEERFSRNAETDLVCRLLLEKKKRQASHRDIQTTHNHTQRRQDTHQSGYWSSLSH